MNMSGFSSQSRQEGDLVVVTLRGDVDLAVAARLWDELHPWLQPGARVIVDCSAVAFIDSMGLRVFLQAVHTAGQQDAEFALASPSATMARVLELSGTADVFTILEGLPAPTAE